MTEEESRGGEAAPLDPRRDFAGVSGDGAWGGGESSISVLRAALTCRCPRCGKGRLFSGLLDLRPECEFCGLDFSRMDVGDGFVVPILMVLGFMIVGAAIWFDFTYDPPLWLHALIWPPVTVLLAVAMTRYLKSFLAVQQYHVRKTEMGL